jgi:hypothetical protein
LEGSLWKFSNLRYIDLGFVQQACVDFEWHCCIVAFVHCHKLVLSVYLCFYNILIMC